MILNKDIKSFENIIVDKNLNKFHKKTHTLRKCMSQIKIKILL